MFEKNIKRKYNNKYQLMMYKRKTKKNRKNYGGNFLAGKM